MTWVFNASPLIILGKIGRLDILRSFKHDFIIPQAVVNEILAGPDDDQAARWARTSPWLKGQNMEMDMEVLSWDPGSGESAVVSCCRTMNDSVAILDDRAARNCAAAFSIPTMGTLGVLLWAKQDGLIAELKPEIEAVLLVGSHLSDPVIQRALKLAGEA